MECSGSGRGPGACDRESRFSGQVFSWFTETAPGSSRWCLTRENRSTEATMTPIRPALATLDWRTWTIVVFVLALVIVAGALFLVP
jgi:hypothetical protein